MKFLKFIFIFLILYLFLRIPDLVEPLQKWQHQILGWNYVGVSANYILFFIFCFYKRKPMAYFGVKLGKWMDHKIWYISVLLLILIFTRSYDLISSGSISFVIPALTTIIFQLLFVSFGEEIFWRGIIQTEFGFWISAIGFGFLHFIVGFDISISYAVEIGVFTFILGMLLGWVRKKTDSVIATAAIHGIYGLVNAIVVVH